MSKQDEVPRPPKCRISKGPTAEDLARAAPQKAWLDEKVNWTRLRRFAHSRVGDAVIGGEIVQEVYNDMLQWTLEELHGSREPQGYVFAVVRSRICDWLKVELRTVPLPADFDNIPAIDLPVEEALANRQQVIALLGRMQMKWLEPWLLCRHYGYTYEEVAQRLHLSVDAVIGRVRRADAYLHVLATMPEEPSTFDRIKGFFNRGGRHHAK